MKTITKNDVMNLMMSGVMSVTVHTLSPEHSYNVYLFKKRIRTAFQDLQDSEREILGMLGVKDIQALHLEDDATIKRYNEMCQKLHAETISMDDVKALPYDEWRKLQDENKATPVHFRGKDITVDVFSGYVEECLENILWVAPQRNNKK